MNRKAFHQLLVRYVEGRCSEAEKNLIDKWYRLLDDETLNPAPSSASMAQVEERLWNKIRGDIGETNITPLTVKRKRVLSYKSGLAAACILGLLLAGYYFLYHSSMPASPLSQKIKQGFKSIENAGSVTRQVMLEDSSLVELQPGARMAYPPHFDKERREVYLEGEALFKVAKAPARPFFVYSNDIVTRVLGTSFIIKPADGGIRVSVLTGKVAVYKQGSPAEEKGDNNGVVITPNQQVVYTPADKHFTTSIVERPVIVLPEHSSTPATLPAAYDETPVKQVLNDLRQLYNLQIEVTNEAINDCVFTGDIADQAMFSKLELLCQAIGASYEIRGTTIIIKGAGCS